MSAIGDSRSTLSNLNQIQYLNF